MKHTIILILFWFCLFLSNNHAQSYVWAKKAGASGFDSGQNITTDASGNVYTIGVFQGTVDFDPGSGTFNLNAAGGQDIFVQKLDALGNFVWAKKIGGGGDDVGYGIAVDASNNVYITGSFQNTVDFDPESGTFNLNSAGSEDIFVEKLDASGNFVWAQAIGGTSADIGNSIAVDASGNVYTTGHFQGTVDFDSGTSTFNLVSVGNVDIFVQKVDASGNFVWAKGMGGTSFDTAYDISVDASSNIYITGIFYNTVDFDPGSGTFNLTAALQDIFVEKLDASGNFVWAKSIGGVSTDTGSSIALDASNNVYITGSFQNTVDFDPGSGTFNITSTSARDIFIEKLDVSGNFVWVKSIEGTGSDAGNSIALDASGNIYTTGFFDSTADFDPGSGTFNLTSVGGSTDFFISKLDASGNFVWALSVGSTSLDISYGITVDASGGIYTTGYFTGTVDFDKSTLVANLVSAGFRDAFVYKVIQCPSISILPSSMVSGTIGSSYNQTLTQTGLNGVSTWSLDAGSLPTGLNLDSFTGDITGTPTTTGTFSFTIKVSNGVCFQTKAYSIVVNCPTITFSNTTVSNATIGTSYSLDASVSGNTATITYSVSPSLPAGLTLNTSTGQITGTPTTTATSATYMVTASQSGGVCTVTQNYTFAVNCPTITFSNTTASNAVIGASYSLDASVSGNTQSITYSITPALPAGLTLNTSTGQITGTPTTTATSATYTVTASQSSGVCTVTQNYTFAVNCPNITINPVSLPNASLLLPYNQTLTQNGLDGVVVWAVSSGTLPVGLTLNSSTGVISGTPTTTQTLNFTIQASNSTCNTTKNYTLSVAPSGAIIEVTSTDIDFGEVLFLQSAKKTITIKNIGNTALNISAINLPDVVFSTATLNTNSIAPNESRDIELIFTPIAVTSYSGTTTIQSNAVAGVNSFTVKGKGINPTSLNINHNQEVEIYPNPVQETLTINIEKANSFEWSIVDTWGKHILQGNSETSRANILIQNLSAGIYFLHIKMAQEVKVVKFVKK
ncbi:MAG: putative Ig domain-containing protein [Raineya sp.]|jgi:hypothetical protein|nr:putative Ig domain-containing protein [Raineya sp.]